MRVLDIFSGIGASALGFTRAGMSLAGLCEIDVWRRDILARHFPGVKIHDDVRTYPGCEAQVIAGGPPCQKTSTASAIWGKRTGETLWPEMLRLGLDMEAEWFVVEQPPRNKPWEAAVASDLAQAGFHSARIEFEASDLGAPHRRGRVFILAHRMLQRLESAWSRIPSEIESLSWGALAGNPWHTGVPRTLRMASGATRDVDRVRRIKAIGDANPPLMYEVIGRALMISRKEGENNG